ncbi:MAG: response regulator [Methylotenera sp.]|jgi:CheY-like chemotaxis protein|uniref:response regulator transcription factor n=1 Tax=Methylotenera sp. TaxID=2051956 RepID=UPI0027191B2F|nr:response regulator [Methylotenera sp.]MDO9149945.1 response regulator [Methylotenera sp.]
MACKLLIVDDNPEVCNLLKLTLAGDAYELKEVSNGVDALDAIKAWRPNIVLLDIMMPGEMNGFQVCKAVKNDPHLKNTYIALLTGKGQAKDIHQGADMGADTYLIKPFSPIVLKTLLARLTQDPNFKLF